jgi:hypothetical protein
MPRRKYDDGLDPRNPYRDAAIHEDKSDAATILVALLVSSVGVAFYFYA